ncbi:Protein DMP [Sesbania bispinosa]|nr:Protein DMP [Sesbania bispinosa]
MIADVSSLNSTETSGTTGQRGGRTRSMTDMSTISSSIGSLIKLLPTGTVFMFQFLNPAVTNSGDCRTSNKCLCAILLVVCGFFCAFASFTDSYTGTDKQRHYGIVTTKGLWPSPASISIDLSEYRLRGRDFVHAALSLFLFALLGLLDINTVHCFYPAFESTQKRLLEVLPPAIGVVVSGVFMMYPNIRHGIGYPLSTDSTDTTPKSNDSAPPPQNPNESA